jgi:hypothetical protein
MQSPNHFQYTPIELGGDRRIAGRRWRRKRSRRRQQELPLFATVSLETMEKGGKKKEKDLLKSCFCAVSVYRRRRQSPLYTFKFSLLSQPPANNTGAADLVHSVAIKSAISTWLTLVISLSTYRLCS